MFYCDIVWNWRNSVQKVLYYTVVLWWSFRQWLYFLGVWWIYSRMKIVYCSDGDFYYLSLVQLISSRIPLRSVSYMQSTVLFPICCIMRDLLLKWSWITNVSYMFVIEEFSIKMSTVFFKPDKQRDWILETRRISALKIVN